MRASRGPGANTCWLVLVGARSAGLDPRQQFERILTLDRSKLGRAEAPIGDAPVDLGTVPERKVGAVHHLRDRYHLEQCRDLPRRVALGELVEEFLELGQGTVRQVGGLALLGEADEP